jgi:hypothetical protein
LIPSFKPFLTMTSHVFPWIPWLIPTTNNSALRD